MTREYDQTELLQRLMRTCGRPEVCRKCKADVLAMTDKDGATILMQENGLVHWVNCGAESRLLRVLHILGQPGRCNSCGVDVVWITSKDGKPTIWNRDGVSHWATCPTADQHKNTSDPKEQK